MSSALLRSGRDRGVATVDADDLRAPTRAHLAACKAPRHVDVVAELPRNAAGKAVKREPVPGLSGQV